MPLTRQDLRYELQHYATKTGLANLENRLQAQILLLPRWTVGTMIVDFGITVGVLSLILKL